MNFTLWYLKRKHHDLFDKGLNLYRERRYIEAFTCFRNGLAMENELIQKALALHTLGKYDGAIEWFDKALILNPHSCYPMFYKGMALDRLGKYDEAIEWFDKSLRLESNDTYWLFSVGLSLNEIIRGYNQSINIRTRRELKI